VKKNLKIQEIASFLLPHIVTAGDYAVEIQKRISHQPDKEGFSDPGSQALTDADLSIQNYIEVVLLSRYPELKFYGEEYQQSLNQKYFTGAKNSEALEVWLDPVDGTLRYKKGQDQFSCIVSFVVDGYLSASLWYMPALRQFVFGSEWDGIRQGTEEDAKKGNLGRTVSLNPETNTIISYQMSSRTKDALSGYRIIDLSMVDHPDVLNLCPIIFSEFSALVANTAGVIDLLVGGHFLKWGGECAPIFRVILLKQLMCILHQVIKRELLQQHLLNFIQKLSLL
jgi:myo-inositol-1(or 4)-monophosphatase